MKEWTKLYRESENRELVIDKMCGEFAHDIEYYADKDVAPEVIHAAMREYRKCGNVIAQIPVSFIEGWRLGSGWFPAMVAQLYLHGAKEGGVNFAERYVRIKSLFNVLGWDFAKAESPKHNRTDTIHKVDYNYFVDGVEETRYYSILLTPTAKYPEGAIFENENGKQWEICYKNEDGSYHLIEEHNGEYDTYIEISITERDMNKMRRIL